MFKRLFAVFISTIQIFMALLGFAPSVSQNNAYPFVMVHGLMGCGQEDIVTNIMPYWGMETGDLIGDLNESGYTAYAASVGPISSAWDRACDLYAQLTGTTVDYGVAHSLEHGHDRFGKTYKNPLFEGWSYNKKINLVGHSFGGATIRLFAQLLAEGCEAERNVTAIEDIYPLFVGGNADLIHSITTLAAPHNGTTALVSLDNESQDLFAGPVLNLATYGLAFIGHMPVFRALYTMNLEQFGLSSVPYSLNVAPIDFVKMKNFLNGTDNSMYDLSLHGAFVLNEKISTHQDIYYFSYAADYTVFDEATGNYVPKDDIFEMFVPYSTEIGKTGDPWTTEDGIIIDSSWQRNDGLVNTISALYPFNEPNVEFDENNIQQGVWNVMPIQNRDHVSFSGGFGNTNSEDLREFYMNHFDCVISTY